MRLRALLLSRLLVTNVMNSESWELWSSITKESLFIWEFYSLDWGKRSKNTWDKRFNYVETKFSCMIRISKLCRNTWKKKPRHHENVYEMHESPKMITLELTFFLPTKNQSKWKPDSWGFLMVWKWKLSVKIRINQSTLRLALCIEFWNYETTRNKSVLKALMISMLGWNPFCKFRN